MNTTWSEHNDATVIRHKFKKVKDSFWVLLTSDVHKDNKKCDVKFLKSVLEEAKAKEAIIIDNGDWFDVMGGKYDKRTSKSDILPKFQEGNYFDLVVQDSVDFLAPYAHLIAILGEGNHEQSVNQRHERNLTKNLIKDLNTLHGGKIIHQKYDGFVRFAFTYDTESTFSTVLYRNHGFGGNSPVTLGVINTNRSQVNVDADIFVYGHIHNKWVVYKANKGLNKNNELKITDKIHIQLSTFKNSVESQWEVSKNFAPPSLGAAWLKFTYERVENNKLRSRRIKTEVFLIGQ
jgi:predicted phosphodiesterase